MSGGFTEMFIFSPYPGAPHLAYCVAEGNLSKPHTLGMRPRSVMIPVISEAGATSNDGFQTWRWSVGAV